MVCTHSVEIVEPYRINMLIYIKNREFNVENVFVYVFDISASYPYVNFLQLGYFIK